MPLYFSLFSTIICYASDYLVVSLAIFADMQKRSLTMSLKNRKTLNDGVWRKRARTPAGIYGRFTTGAFAANIVVNAAKNHANAHRAGIGVREKACSIMLM